MKPTSSKVTRAIRTFGKQFGGGAEKQKQVELRSSIKPKPKLSKASSLPSYRGDSIPPVEGEEPVFTRDWHDGTRTLIFRGGKVVLTQT